jgi:F0F1-type ATP synthase beta subunit
METKTALSNIGVVASVRGSVVDLRFDKHLPAIYSVLRAGDKGRIVIEVLAQRDARCVRGIALTPTQGLEQLSPEDRKVVAGARRLERFLTQPFFTTGQFTGLKGKLVSLKDSLDGCERVLRDEFKDYPEALVGRGTKGHP